MWAGMHYKGGWGGTRVQPLRVCLAGTGGAMCCTPGGSSPAVGTYRTRIVLFTAGGGRLAAGGGLSLTGSLR